MNRKEDFKIALAERMTDGYPSIVDREIDVPLAVDVIVSLVGPRRAGKTFLMYCAIECLLKQKVTPLSNILYINFEHERLSHLSVLDLEDMMAAFYEVSSVDLTKPVYLFLDEIQNVEGWSKWVNRMYEKKRYRIYISGSTSKLLMRELSSEIRGRGIDITVLPLSFHEYLAFKDVKLEHPKLLSLSAARGNILRYLSEYMTGGAYPEVVRNPNIHTSLLRSYLDTIIVKDVGERFHIEPSILRAFIEYSINNYAKYLSGTKIYNYLRTLNFRLAKELPQTLLQDFNEVFALFPVEISSRSIKSKEQYPKKVYLVDNGLAQLVTRKTDYGRMMENIVFLELYRRSHGLQLFEINYWKEYGKAEGKEVDFIIRRGGRTAELINVSYVSSEEEISQRELKGLELAGKEFACKNLKVITWDYELKEEIEFVPMWRWLIEDSIQVQSPDK